MAVRVLRCALLLGVLAVPTAQAQEDGAQARPPFTIGGFRYLHVPPRTHMNVCESASCTPDAKVSYMLFAPNPAPSFEKYQAERKMIAKALQERATRGTTFAFDPPQQSKDNMFTIFTSRRVETYPDGRMRVFLSQRLYSARLTADIISSAPSEKAAKANLAVFTLPIMLLAQGKAGAPTSR